MAEDELQSAPGGEIEPYIAAAELEIARRFEEAELVINEWLDEADEEGRAIVERATHAAEQLLLEAHAQVAELRATAAEHAASTMREADEHANYHRQVAADEAAVLLADSRAQAERQLQEAAREADFRLAQAQAEAEAMEHRAGSTVASLRADVGALQEQLVKLVNNATAVLPHLDNAARGLAAEAELELSGELVEEQAPASGAAISDDVVDAEIVEPVAEPEPEPEPVPEPVVRHRGLGQLVPESEEENADEFDLDRDPGVPHIRRRGLGRLLGRR
jgi:hypothetical protein